MSERLDSIKLEQLGPKCQVVLFDEQGLVSESCNTLLTINKSVPLFEQFDFLLSLQDVLKSLQSEPLVFDLVEWHEQKEALFSITFQRKSAKQWLWFIVDRSHEREQILTVQQSRNNAAINEEVLAIQQKYLEAEKKLLAYRNDELLRIQKFKQRFFAEVSHEMRTPLHSITGLVKLLETTKSQDVPSLLHALKATSQHLNHVINDVLDLSKIEEGKLQLEELAFELKDILDSIVRGFTLSTQEKGIVLETTIAPGVPQIIVSDPIRLSQVLYNLIGNAIKFTHSGSVTLAVEPVSQKAKSLRLKFSVHDTGVGMSEESIAKILEPFTQVEGQSFYEYGGTGLGMGIAQGIIETMGGHLKIKSELGKGTSMWFSIDCKPGEVTQYTTRDYLEEPSAASLQNLRVLFAEDDAMSTMMLKQYADNWGLSARFVETLPDLKALLWSESYDLLVCDLHLGDDHSAGLIEELRTTAGPNRQVPIIFLSGDAQNKHPELSSISQWAYLVKPANPKTLALKIRDMAKPKHNTMNESVDLTHLKNSAQGNLAFLIDLIETIMENLPKDLQKLKEALDQPDYETCRKMLHKVKPSIGYLGIPDLLEERNRLYDLVAEQRLSKEEVLRFANRIEAALSDLKRQKEELQ
ncbi:ATP-binding protein [Roseivirga sp. UBA838]|uniref:hybrid sensor histidine kinase/response regulator n=1 Tax=Roseivirga sp. UBA838 TaxID=1947393 RepID=UPI00257EB788|nr:ATP-binding protein [Roseivirga sp. UBA838]|tara:strand:+ start:97805 stop:99718 length:1914 start_codon:yes stop_codon:yes gene_type:complete